ncbi:high affinity immunoglobulin gamma Fc receptor I-like [Archocentrus centrarchus]|uniref:high affinity immunoglobulin gamma Fc receptor I-like n=1 Tax=Archocentrus centrarchus TaxID=63155 RepID=UPI0011EA318B|nr:high affinity immunoglobulin gamma Fc receptor I-like [Archocentrus centrarchus]
MITVSDILRRVRGNMEVTGLCIKLMVIVLILLTAEDQKCIHAQKSEGAHLHVHPNTLQFFEYDTISLNCSGFHGPAEWRVIKKLALNSTQWETSTRTLDIKPAITSDSGEYWCENEDGEKSKSVNITITSGDVLLEIPAFPVMEGNDVTLSCRKKGISSNLAADFYKDGHHIDTGYTGKMTIYNVSKSNEGLYKCSFSQSQGKSSESWLAVRAYIVPAPEETIPQDNQDSLQETATSTESTFLLPAVFTTLGVAVLIVVGVFYCRKHRVCVSSKISTPVYEDVRVPDLNMDTCDNVRKNKKKGRQGANAADPDRVTYAAVTVKPKRERAL